MRYYLFTISKSCRIHTVYLSRCSMYKIFSKKVAYFTGLRFKESHLIKLL